MLVQCPVGLLETLIGRGHLFLGTFERLSWIGSKLLKGSEFLLVISLKSQHFNGQLRQVLVSLKIGQPI